MNCLKGHQHPEPLTGTGQLSPLSREGGIPR